MVILAITANEGRARHGGLLARVFLGLPTVKAFLPASGLLRVSGFWGCNMPSGKLQQTLCLPFVIVAGGAATG